MTDPPLRDPWEPRLDVGALSEREREVLAALIGHGQQAPVSAALQVSLHTLRNHKANIMQKLNVLTIGQAMVLYDRWCRR